MKLKWLLFRIRVNVSRIVNFFFDKLAPYMCLGLLYILLFLVVYGEG